MMADMARHEGAALRWGLALLLAGAAMAAGAASPVQAEERVALPGGAALALFKRELQLVDAQGAVRARLA